MSGSCPLIVLDTNILLDFWLGRDPDAGLLIDLADAAKVEIRVPEFVLAEFRGRALRLASEARIQLEGRVWPIITELSRCQAMGSAVTDLRAGTEQASLELEKLKAALDPVIERLRRSCVIVEHRPSVHLRGELRFLAGRPPDQPGRGLADCRIFECVLDIARTDAATARGKRVFVSTDSDFHDAELQAELAGVGFSLHRDVGALYGAMR